VRHKCPSQWSTVVIRIVATIAQICLVECCQYVGVQRLHPRSATAYCLNSGNTIAVKAKPSQEHSKGSQLAHAELMLHILKHMRACTHTHARARTHAHTQTHTHTHIHTHTNMNTHTHTGAYACAPPPHKHRACARTCTRTRVPENVCCHLR
jgi:hypothetical protein